MSFLQHYGHRYKVSFAEVTRNWISNARLYRRRKLPENQTFDDKVIIVTGGNRGIGRKVCDLLVQRKVKRLIIACRDMKLGQAAIDEMKSKETEATTEFAVYQLDLASKESIKKFADEIKEKEPQVDVLINNAGILCKERRETLDGHEIMIAVNYFGTVLLTFLLFDHIKTASGDPRIIFVSSLAHTEVRRLKIDDLDWEKEKSFPYFQVYGHSKLALLLFLKNLATKSKEQGVLIHAVDPGISKTDLGREANETFGLTPQAFMLRGGVARPGMRSVTESATSVIMPLASKKEDYDVKKYNTTDGLYQRVSPAADDQETADKLWSLTAEHLNLEAMKNL